MPMTRRDLFIGLENSYVYNICTTLITNKFLTTHDFKLLNMLRSLFWHSFYQPSGIYETVGFNL